MAKSFSVVMDTGIKGFPAGKKVTLVREVGNDFVVTDGEMEATAPKSSFTNDLLVVKELTKPRPVIKKAPAAMASLTNPVKATASGSSPAATEESPYDKQKRLARLARKQLVQAQIAALGDKIAAAEQEIAEKQSKQRPVRRTYSPSGVLLSYQGHSSYTLSANASALPRMTAQLEKLQQELATFE